MLNGSNIIRSLWRRLARNREGNVALIFGLAMIPIVCAAGVAIDATRAYQVKVRLGTAMDAAALAVGSSTAPSTITDPTAIQAWMGQRLTNYFKANYPPGALGQNVTITPVGTSSNPSGNLTSSSVTFQAQATVPMTFMSLVGFKPVTVTVTNQIHKSAGLEVVLVLDNTGSMLCGPNDGAPTYSPASLCQGNVVASDTNCTNPSNQSRICTLRNAATQFVNTLVNAISSQQQLLIGVVPYVTTVNVGSLFCSNSTTCSNMATDGCSATGWINEIGSVIANPNPITFTGKLTNGSATVSNLSANANDLYAGAFNPF